MSHLAERNGSFFFSETNNAAELIIQYFERHADKKALINGGDSVYYAEFARYVVSIQQQLIQAGVGNNDVVGLLLHRDQWLIPAMVATLAIGATFVPLDSTYPLSRLESYVDVAKPKILLAHLYESELAKKLHDRVINPAISNEGEVVCVTRQKDDIAYILFTSGSTGQPKGVSIGHQALYNFLTAIAERLKITSSHVFLAHTTVAFDISILELLLPLSVGGTVLLANNDEVSSIEGILPLIDKSDFVQATPSLWKILLATGWHPDTSVTLLSGGEELPLALANKINQTCSCLWNMYGPTEATIWTSCEQVDIDADYISIGKPLLNTQLHVMNDDLEPCEYGELYISGLGLAQGYHGNREGTDKVFITHPKTKVRLYRSGDRVRLREQGRIEWLGRGDSEIKIRGNRIGVSEIEQALESISGIAGAVVVARKFEGRGDDMLTAYIISKAILTKLSLEIKLGEQFPEYMIPDLFVVLPEFPLQPNGKFDKKSLPEPNWNNTLHHCVKKNISELTDTLHKNISEMVCDIFSKILGRNDFNSEASFFDMGGNSALAVVSAGIISSRLKKKIPVSLIVSGENPNSIADKILNFP